jgi:hypothetical protein
VTDPRVVAQRVAATLDRAEAVALVGSVAAGTHHDRSDIDLVVIGDGEEYTLLVEDGWLVSLSWRSAEEVRAAFAEPGSAVLAVPAWRGAVILADENEVAASLRADAVAWSWDRCGDVDDWAARELTGYAEEVVRLRGAIARRDETVAAVMTALLALRLAGVVAVFRRLLLPSENDLWRAVGEVEGPPWVDAQRRALGLDGEGWAARADGALRLFGLAAAVIDPVLGDRRRAVVERALDPT